MKRYESRNGLRRLIAAILTVGWLGGANGQEPLKFDLIQIGEPIGFRNPQGELDGMYHEIMMAIETESGLDLAVTLAPYNRMLQDLETGRADCSIFFTSQARKKKFTQVAEVVTRKVLAVSRAGLKIGKLEDLYGKTVGHIRGAHYGERFDDNPNIKKRTLNSYQSGLEMLRSGRIDAFVGAKEFIDEMYDDYGEGRFVVIQVKESWLQCSKASMAIQRDPSLLERLRASVEGLKHESEDRDVIFQIHRRFIPTYRRD